MPKVVLQRIYSRLFSAFGRQYWWPGETRLEIIIGAILTQNTNWKNVERAIINLRKAKLLSFDPLLRVSLRKLAQLIRPSGYFNIKSKRLKNFIKFIEKDYGGSLTLLQKQPMDKLRIEFLSVNGIGPETADSILLYAFEKPVFVIDAYTKRLFYRYGIIGKDVKYEDLQEIFMQHLKADTQMFNEYHALIVKLAKEHCRSRPLCEKCPLEDTCRKRF